MKRKFISTVLILAMLLSCFGPQVFAAGPAPALAQSLKDGGAPGSYNIAADVEIRTLLLEGTGIEGLGTPGSPYRIETAEQLTALATSVNGGESYKGKYFLLTEDIDLTSISRWTPIGTPSSPFSGTFEGGRHEISNLKFINESSDYVGLFGYVLDGSVKNLGVVSVEIVGGSYLGGVVGCSVNGTILNCYNKGLRVASNAVNNVNIGGIVGSSTGGVVDGCYNTGTVISQSRGNRVGGIVGEMISGTVQNCYNTGGVSSEGTPNNGIAVGGIVGYSNKGMVQNCYNTGGVIGSQKVGGIVGSANDTTISSCYNGGDVNSEAGTHEGGILGDSKAEQGNTVKDNNFARSDKVGKGDVGGGTPVDAEDSKSLADQLGDAWADTDDGPVLKSNSDGLIYSDGVYYIPNLPVLKQVRDMINGVGVESVRAEATAFLVVRDINLDDESWDPIGNRDNPLKIIFDGGGHKISVKTITANSDGVAGLFGYVESTGTVKNLGVAGGPVTGGNYAGGIVAMNNGTVENCYNDCSVENGTQYTGGIVANNAGTVKNCYNTGAVTSSSGSKGAIVGEVNGTVKNCYYKDGSCENPGGGTSKPINDFASGAVAYALQKGSRELVWGQDFFGGDGDLPKIYSDGNAKQVVKVTFETKENKNYKVRYTNQGEMVGNLPELPEQLQSVAWWYSEELEGEFKADTPVDKDMTVIAVKQDSPSSSQPGGSEITLTHNRENKVLDLNGYIAYESGRTDKTGLFEYTIDSGNDELGAALGADGHTLTISASARPGDYTLLITATEESPQVMPVALDSFVAQSVPLTLQVKIVLPGSGTPGNPYLIETPVALGVLGSGDYAASGQYFRLDKDLDLGGTTSPWRPITTFSGVFDGNGHSIDGLYPSTNTGSAGLFAENTGTIKNLAVAGEVSGSSTIVGGIVCSNSGTVENCHSDVRITVQSAQSAGGVVGTNSGTVQNCYNTGDVSVSGAGNSSAGGVVGTSTDGTVQNCYNTGSVSVSGAGSSAGGVVGTDSNTVQNCYYQEGCQGEGTQFNDIGTARPAAGFASGEVARLLQDGQSTQVWGQSLGGDTPDESPILLVFTDNPEAYRVVKVTFAAEDGSVYDNGVVYGNPGKKVKLLLLPEDSYARVWRKDSVDGPVFDGTVEGTEDFTVYSSGWQEMYGGETDPDELTLTTTYGRAVTKDLDEYIGYAGGSEVAGNFTYEITNYGGLTAASIDGSVLTIPAGAPANEAGYTLTITATEVEPKFRPFSIGDFGTQEVTLKLTVIIHKAAQAAPTGDITVTKTKNSITVKTPTGDRYEFSLDGITWQSVGQFDGLKPATKYTVWVRFKEDGNHTPSDAVTKTVTTANADGSGTVLPGETLETENGSVSNNGDNVTVEDGQGNTATVTPPPKDGAEVLPDGSVKVPGGSTVTDSKGNTSTAPSQGGVISSDGTYSDNSAPGAGDGSGAGDGGGGAGGGGGGGAGGGGGSAGGSVTGIDEKPADPKVSASDIYIDVVKGSWYEPSVTFVTEMGLFYGVGDRLFGPDLNMTRAMFVTVLARLDGQDTGSGDNWYVKGMEWAVANGICDGTHPEANITREQIVAMLYRYAKATRVEGDLTAFVDFDLVSDWATDAMIWAVSKGILLGKDGRRLDPQGFATRAEVAAILQRFVEQVK